MSVLENSMLCGRVVHWQFPLLHENLYKALQTPTGRHWSSSGTPPMTIMSPPMVTIFIRKSFIGKGFPTNETEQSGKIF